MNAVTLRSCLRGGGGGGVAAYAVARRRHDNNAAAHGLHRRHVLILFLSSDVSVWTL